MAVSLSRTFLLRAKTIVCGVGVSKPELMFLKHESFAQLKVLAISLVERTDKGNELAPADCSNVHCHAAPQRNLDPLIPFFP
jgi:hypothetical protein